MINLNNPSSIIEKQLLALFDLDVITAIANSESDTEISDKIKTVFKSILREPGKPLMQERYFVNGNLPDSDVYNRTMVEVYIDLIILYEEMQVLANGIVNHFNYSQVEKNKLLDRIKQLNEMVTDYQVLANEVSQNYYAIKETFNNKNNVDLIATKGSIAHISTKEGIATLRRNESENLSLTAKIKDVAGNGEKGNYHVIRQVVNDYSSIENAHDDANIVLDDKPDTWFEYQTVNIPDADKVNYRWLDIGWGANKETGDLLRLIVTLELEKASNINWITVNPYLAPNSTGKVTVYSISTSEDGTDFVPLYDNKLILNSKLNLTPESYDKNDIYSSDDFDTSKFSQQGVWSFPTRQAKYVQLVFDQYESYKEKIGHTYYKRVIKNNDLTTEIRISEAEVSDEIRSGALGQYSISDTETIVKGIEVSDGWRYAIGLRDIGVYQFKFSEKSEISSVKYTTPKEINRVTLSSNEKIPDQLLGLVEERNEWIKYYISLDDVNWYQISPLHHQRIGDTEIPPQIYLINSPLKHENLEVDPNRGYININGSATSIRLKVVLSRPITIENAESFTPILEDYVLKLYLEDEEEK